jgi:hypothetical protein
MALLTISRAISTGIQRNVAIGELKHEAKLEDIKLSLAAAKDLRIKDHAKRHTEATIAHATWHQGLNPQQQEQYLRSLELLQSAINPPKPSE